MSSQAEANFLALVESTEDLIWSVDPSYRLMAFNRAFEQHIVRNFGVVPATGMSTQDWLPPVMVSRWPPLYARAFAEGAFRTEFSLLDGRILELSLQPILVDKEAVGISIFGKDITHRRKTETALQQAEDNYRKIFDGALEGIFQTSGDGKPLVVNQALAKMLGYDSPEELVSSVNAPGEEVWADPSQLTEFLSLLDQKGSVLGFECRLRRKDGTDLWASLNAQQIKGPDGSLLHFEGFVEDISKRREAIDAFIESESRFRKFFENNGSVMLLIDPADGRIADANRAASAFYGYSKEQLIGMPISQLNALPPAALAEEMARALRQHASHFYFRHRLASGAMRDVGVYSTPIEIGGRPMLSSIVHDVTERRLTAEALARSEERYRVAFQTSLDMIFVSRLDTGEFIEVNKSFLDALGFDREEVLGKTSLDLGIWVDDSLRPQLAQVLRQDSAFRDLKTQLRKKNGELVWVLISASTIEIEGVPSVLTVLRDISDAKAAEDQIRNLAYYDPLTRLPNRRLLRDRLQQSLAGAARHRRNQALLFVGLDHFKTLNDALGHSIGDLLLQEVAQRIPGCVRETDTVARLGGDEFAVLLEGLGESERDAAAQAGNIAAKVLDSIAQPFSLEGHTCRATASIGIAIYGNQIESTDGVLQQADIALSKAKSAGPGALRFFSPALQAAVTARAELEDDLRRAIDGNQFLLYYQPQVERDCLTGSEALLRWNHPRKGFLNPVAFIPLAEETGLILPLGDWVLETACAQLVAWAAHPQTANLTVSVNISARQFRQPEFAQNILATLRRTGANPARLRLELTESMLVDDIEEVIARMAELQAHGLRFSLDDFGTGYSSLAYLKRLPFDRLKIDRSFVRDLLVDATSGAIAQTVISLSRAMGLAVIAEGVETEEQHQRLRGLGCHAFQGYLFSRPLPVDGFLAFVSDFPAAHGTGQAPR